MGHVPNVASVHVIPSLLNVYTTLRASKYQHFIIPARPPPPPLPSLDTTQLRSHQLRDFFDINKHVSFLVAAQEERRAAGTRAEGWSA